MQNEPVILGIDIGGTKVALAQVSASGRLLSQMRYPLRASSVTDFPQTLFEKTDAFLGQTPIEGIGVGLKGMIDADHHTILHSSILAGLLPYDLCDALSRRFGAPCYIDNDVHAATLAEMAFGHGRTYGDFVFVNLGTGMAVGIVSDGRLLRGAHNLAGELGVCSALRPMSEDAYPLEALVSGKGMATEALRLKDQFPISPLARRSAEDGITGQDVLNAHRAGDPLALRVVENLLDALSRTLGNLTLLLDPDLFVFGGGVVSDGYLLALLNARMETYCRAQGLRAWRGNATLSAIGSDETGVLGAASVFLNARDAHTRKD